jgi:two-component system phosphate regulon response regulator PhoB
MPVAIDTQKHILIVDRDIAAVEPLRQKLCDAGFIARLVADGTAAITAVAERPPHLVILDWNMPGFTALELIAAVRRVRRPHAIRMILLSALSGEPDVVQGFNLGADDYIVKPYSPREVVARVFSVLRSRKHENHHSVVSSNGLVLDASTASVTIRGQSLNLRGVEYRLLEFFMLHPGRTFNRTQLLAQIWGSDFEVDERTIDVNVQRLRKALIKQGIEKRIQTVRGFGYRFADAGAEQR